MHKKGKEKILSIRFKFFIFLVLSTFSHGSLHANASDVVGIAKPWQLSFQASASPVMANIRDLHTILLWIITGIGLFVTALVFFVVWRFREKKNPVPSQNSHNTVLEIVWTVIPVLILAFIAFPSFKLIYYMDRIEDADITVKVIGHQWYWTYEYPDQGNVSYDSYMIPDNDLKPGQPRLLAVDKPIYVPVNKNVRVIVTSADVIHSWAVPALGIKKDAVPGRINETWLRALKPGVYYGQCSELCGPGHGFMPIELHAVPQEEFDQWIRQARGQ